MAGTRPTDRFLQGKFRALKARAGRLLVLTPARLGLRAQDAPFAPSAEHFAAVNRRLSQIGGAIARQIAATEAVAESGHVRHRLTSMALVEREADRARRMFGMFFEIFSQRGTHFGPALAAHDVIAADCYAAIRATLPNVFPARMLKPLTYMEHSFSPATNRRGIALARLMGDSNPMPVIRIPWDRSSPWESVFLHEVSHNLQSDLGLWHELPNAVARRLTTMRFDPLVVTVYRRWNKEIFADLAALLLGGTASAWGMMEFLAHPGTRALTYRPGGAHPTGWFRALIIAEMVRRMGFRADAAEMEKVWRRLYDPGRGHRLPTELLAATPRVVPAIVDEIAYQPRRALAQHALADVIPFRREDEVRIRRAALQIAAGRVPEGMPPRFFVTASRLAMNAGGDSVAVSRLVIDHLSRLHARIGASRRSMSSALAA